MTVVTGSNLNTESWRVVNSLLSGNVVDPFLAKRTNNLQWIFGAFPDFEAAKRPNFPVIVIDNPTADMSPQTFAQGAIRDTLSFSVRTYSLNAQEVNEIMDDVQDAFMQNRKALTGSNLSLVSLDAGIQGIDIVNNRRVHSKEILASFKLASTSA